MAAVNADEDQRKSGKDWPQQDNVSFEIQLKTTMGWSFDPDICSWLTLQIPPG